MTEYQVHRIRFVPYEPKAVNCTAFEDSERERLAVCREDGRIEIWATPTNGIWSIDFIIPSRVERSIDSVAWCNSRLFTAGLEGEVIEWDLVSLSEKNKVDANGGPVWCIAASNDKCFIAAGCEDGSVRLFDIQYDALQPAKALDKQEFRVLSLAWSKCDSIIVTGSTDSTIRVYDVKSRHVILRISTDKLREKNTLIWSIYLTSNMTVISGDSLGQTQFWDAEMGTLLKSFKSHEADVLSICVTKDEQSVYSSGIDSRIAEFNFVKEESENDGEWRITRKFRSVSHDIRTLSVTNGADKCLIAGGVDPRLTKFKISTKDESHTFLSTFPDIPPCSFAKEGNILVFHETNKIHVWKLPMLGDQPGENKTPSKLLELKSPKDEFITSADISPKGNVLVFADVNDIFGYTLTYTETKSDNSGIQVAKIKIKKHATQGVQRIKLFPDGMKVVFASSKGIGIMQLCKEESAVSYIDTTSDVKGPWRLLEIDQEGKFATAVNDENEIYILNLNEMQVTSKVPQLRCKPLTIKFHPKTTKVVFVCAEKELHIYDYITEKLDHWCSKLNGTLLLKHLPTKKDNFINIVFDQEDNNVIFIQSESGIVKVKIGAKIGEEKKLKRARNMCISSIKKYNSLLFLDVTKENSLVVVEQPIDDLMNALPPALKIKKFGT